MTHDANGYTAAERHSNKPEIRHTDVRWKDVLDNSGKGPDPVIARSRGAVCVFPQDQKDPIWVPERLTRKVHRQEEEGHTSTEPVQNEVEEHNSVQDNDSPDNRETGDAMGNSKNMAYSHASS